MKYILNHSFKVDNHVYDSFIEWIHNYCQQSDYTYQLSEMIVPADEEDKTMILQIFLEKDAPLEASFVLEYQNDFQMSLYAAFHAKALSFITLMKQL